MQVNSFRPYSPAAQARPQVKQVSFGQNNDPKKPDPSTTTPEGDQPALTDKQKDTLWDFLGRLFGSTGSGDGGGPYGDHTGDYFD